MTHSQRWFSAATTTIFFLAILFAETALASSAGGHGDAHGPSSAQWTTLVFTVINFSIFVFLMFRFTKAPLVDFLTGRRRELVEAMSAAARAKEEAEQLKAEYEEKSAQLEETRRTLIEEFKEMAAKDRERILEEAAASTARMLRDVKLRADNELDQAKRELRAETARLAAEMAEAEIRGKLDPAVRGRLLGEFLEGVTRV
jgi:F-type H+-transporting ATPase subunit b